MTQRMCPDGLWTWFYAVDMDGGGLSVLRYRKGSSAWIRCVEYYMRSGVRLAPVSARIVSTDLNNWVMSKFRHLYMDHGYSVEDCVGMISNE
jgi:hypothetical protein